MITVRIAVPFSVPLSEWVTSTEPYWITFAARRSVESGDLALQQQGTQFIGAEGDGPHNVIVPVKPGYYSEL